MIKINTNIKSIPSNKNIHFFKLPITTINHSKFQIQKKFYSKDFSTSNENVKPLNPVLGMVPVNTDTVPSLSNTNNTSNNTSNTSSNVQNSSIKTNNNVTKEYDIVIIGGGLVGTSFAASLATTPLTSDLKIALIDPQLTLSTNKKPSNSKTPDMRTSAVTPTTIKLFQAIGAWDNISPHKSSFYDKMEVWDSLGNGTIRFNASDIGEKYLGYIIENNYMLDNITERVENMKNIDLLKKSVKGIETYNVSYNNSNNLNNSNNYNDINDIDRAIVHLDSGEKLITRLIVGSDGARSKIRELLTMPLVSWEYKQKAICATISTSQLTNTTFQRFLPTGPIALLPCGIDENSSKFFANIVWSTTPEHADQLLKMEPIRFVEELNNAFFNDFASENNDRLFQNNPLFKFLPKPNLVFPSTPVPPYIIELVENKRGSFPLRASQSSEYVRRRVALLGDAAHTIHPMAGQGLNMGIGDVISLTKTIQRGLETGTDIGDLNLLKEYQRSRGIENAAMIGLLDTIKRTFGFNLGPFPFIRSAGMVALDKVSPVKQKMVHFISGFNTKLDTIGTAIPNIKDIQDHI